MWVWSDDLVERLDGVQTQVGATFPLVAYAVGPETDLDAFAVEVLGVGIAAGEPAVESGVSQAR